MILVAQRGPNLPPLKILSGVHIRKEGPADELLEWLKKQGFTRPRDPRTGYQMSYSRRSQPLAEGTVRALWGEGNMLGQLVDFFVDYHTTDSRLQLLGGASVPNLYGYDDTSNHPMHALYFDRSAMDELSALAERAFGMPLTLNRYGAAMQLHLGVPNSRKHSRRLPCVFRSPTPLRSSARWPSSSLRPLPAWPRSRLP